MINWSNTCYFCSIINFKLELHFFSFNWQLKRYDFWEGKKSKLGTKERDERITFCVCSAMHIGICSFGDTLFVVKTLNGNSLFVEKLTTKHYCMRLYIGPAPGLLTFIHQSLRLKCEQASRKDMNWNSIAARSVKLK